MYGAATPSIGPPAEKKRTPFPTVDLPTVILEPAVAEVEYDTGEGTASIPVTCSAEDSNPAAQVSGSTSKY